MKTTIVRMLGFVFILEVVYLIVANVVLNIPLTQTLLNQRISDKQAIHWERALTWHPLRMHVSGFAANGRTTSQLWQFDTTQASFSLSILPLRRRTLQFRTVRVEDADVRVRSLPKTAEDDAARRAFYPPVRDRDPDRSVAPVMPGPGGGWQIAIDDLQADGDHQIWVNQVRASLQGNLTAGINYTTRGGPFALADGSADVVVESLMVNGESALADTGTISSQFDMAPFVPSQNRGRKALGFLSVDSRLDLAVDGLAFLDVFLHRFDTMEVDGKGRLRGRLHYVKGKLMNDTAMEVLASALVVKVSSYTLKGKGRIALAADIRDTDAIDMRIVFDALSAVHDVEQQVLFSGEGLEISVSGVNTFSADTLQSSDTGRLDIRIPQVRVADLSAYQHLLPEKWRLQLRGGTGTLQGEAALSARSTRVDFQLQSDVADLEFKQHRFTTNLDVNISAVGDTSDAARLDLGGSYLKLENAQLTKGSRAVSSPWNAALLISEGTINLPLAARTSGEADVDYLVRTIRDPEPRDLLSRMNADVTAQLNISELSWLNLLFRNPFDLSLSGAGVAEADIGVRAGWLARGTTVSVTPQDLRMQVLDYAAQGQGRIVVAVERGGKAPDLSLDISLTRGSLKRRGKGGAVVEDVHLEVAARAQHVSFDGNATVTEVDVRIPSARVKDVSVYNQYFPDRLPFRLTTGEAQLTSSIHLTPKAAEGSIILQTDHFESRLGDQQLSGALTMDINIANGVPADMEFDISGSSLHFHDVKVAGDQMLFEQADWSARLDFEDAWVDWQVPVKIDVKAMVSLRDSRPFTALLANQRGKHGWLERLLTVEDIRGEASFLMSSDELRVPYAFASSDGMDIGAKALINSRTSEGIVFARYGKISGVLKLKDGERDFDVFGARKKFDRYIPGQSDVFAINTKPLPQGEADPR